MNKTLLATLLPVALAAAYGNPALAQDTAAPATPAAASNRISSRRMVVFLR